MECEHVTFDASVTGSERDPMPNLFTPFTLKGVTLRNRIVMSPMTMYRSVEGRMDDYHV